METDANGREKTFEAHAAALADLPPAKRARAKAALTRIQSAEYQKTGRNGPRGPGSRVPTERNDRACTRLGSLPGVHPIAPQGANRRD